MITKFQVASHVHATIVDACRAAASTLKLADLVGNAKQRDVGMVKDEFERWANWHARKIDLAREQDRKRRDKRAAIQVPTPGV